MPCLHPHDCEPVAGMGHLFISLEPESERLAAETKRNADPPQNAEAHGKWAVVEIGATAAATAAATRTWSTEPNVCNLTPGKKTLEMNSGFWGKTSHTIAWNVTIHAESVTVLHINNKHGALRPSGLLLTDEKVISFPRVPYEDSTLRNMQQVR